MKRKPSILPRIARRKRKPKPKKPRVIRRGYLGSRAKAENFSKFWSCKVPNGVKELHTFNEPVNETVARRFFRKKNYPNWKGLPVGTKVEQWGDNPDKLEFATFYVKRKIS